MYRSSLIQSRPPCYLLIGSATIEDAPSGLRDGRCPILDEVLRAAARSAIRVPTNVAVVHDPKIFSAGRAYESESDLGIYARDLADSKKWLAFPDCFSEARVLARRIGVEEDSPTIACMCSGMLAGQMVELASGLVRSAR